QNAGAQYWVEAQYVTADDAAAKNQMNNASYRGITVGPSPFNLTLTGSTQRMKSAIEAWPTVDASVLLSPVSAPSDGRLNLGARATPLGGGIWHYEYAFYNMNSNRAVQSFT